MADSVFVYVYSLLSAGITDRGEGELCVSFETLRPLNEDEEEEYSPIRVDLVARFEESQSDQSEL